MKFTAVAALLSLATAASARAVPASRQGPLSFQVSSNNEDFNGKWLVPAVTPGSAGMTTATLSSSRFRRFFLTADNKLEYDVKPGVTVTARINDLLKIYPLLATVSFKQSVTADDADDLIKTETTFKINDNGVIDVRNGKQWFACKQADGSIIAKVLVVGQQSFDETCAQITLHSVDGIAK